MEDTALQSRRLVHKRFYWMSILSLAVLIVVLLSTVNDYGMSWDEPFRFHGGQSKLEYYEALFAGEELPDLVDNYPGLFDLPLALFRKHFPGLGSMASRGMFGVCALVS